MQLEELEANIKGFAKEYESAKNKAIGEYCFSNNTVKVGDIFTDHIGSIVVESIKVSAGFGKYQCVYFGAELTKKLEPKKNGAKRRAYQQNAAT